MGRRTCCDCIASARTCGQSELKGYATLLPSASRHRLSSRANTPAQVATRAERVGAVIEPNADPRHRKTTFELVGDTDEQQSLGIALRCTSTGLSHRPRVARAARACHPQLRVIRARFGMSDSVERSGRKTHTVEKRPAAAGAVFFWKLSKAGAGAGLGSGHPWPASAADSAAASAAASGRTTEACVPLEAVVVVCA